MLVDHDWLLSLARPSPTRFLALSSVTLLETREIGRGHSGSELDLVTIVDDGGWIEWEYPMDVKDSFQGSGIKLKVMILAVVS